MNFFGVIEMPLQINFQENFANRCAEMLEAEGYEVPSGSPRDVIRAYATVRNRRVSARVRGLHKANYQVPTHLREGESLFLSKVTAGHDLWPHQSRKISKTGIEDGMLNDFGIQHFHLGTQPDSKHSHLIAGTKELLFAVVTNTDFYAIGIYDHDAWSEQGLLDVIHATWPQLMRSSMLNADSDSNVVGLSAQYSDADHAKLRAAGVNVITQRPDGSIHMPPGGGVTTAKTGMKVAREVIQILDFIQRLESEVADAFAPLIANSTVAPDAIVVLEWRGDETFAVTVPPGAVEIDLNRQLSVPAL